MCVSSFRSEVDVDNDKWDLVLLKRSVHKKLRLERGQWWVGVLEPTLWNEEYAQGNLRRAQRI